MENVRHVAMYAVGKAVFFGGFAISITMLAFAFDFSLSFRAGAILTLIMSGFCCGLPRLRIAVIPGEPKPGYCWKKTTGHKIPMQKRRSAE